MSESNIKSASLQEIRKMKEAGRLESNLVPQEGDELDEDFWANAEIVDPPTLRSVHLKLDPEVFAYFKGQGKGHITRMQEVLKAYVRHQQRLHR